MVVEGEVVELDGDDGEVEEKVEKGEEKEEDIAEASANKEETEKGV